MRKVKIGLVSSGKSSRQRLKEFLLSDAGFEVIFETNNGADVLLNLINEYIDALVIFLVIPDRDSQVLLNGLRMTFPDLKIIVFLDNYSFKRDLLEINADLTINSNSTIQEMSKKIRDFTSLQKEQFGKKAIKEEIDKKAKIVDKEPILLNWITNRIEYFIILIALSFLVFQFLIK